MEDFKKYGLANLELRAVHTQDDPVLAELTKEMDEVNAIVNEILNQFAKIDSSIKAWQGEFFNFSSTCFDVAGGISSKYENSKRDPSVGEVLVGVGAMAVGLVSGAAGLVGGAVKKYKANKEKQRQLDEALELKKQVAEEKMPYIGDVRKRMSTLGAKIEKLYSAEFGKQVNVSDENLKKKTEIFKKVFIMAVQKRVLNDTMDFVRAEMSAWLSGRHNSDYKPKTLADILAEEMSGWRTRLGPQISVKSTNWKDFILAFLKNAGEEVPVPLSFLLTEPAMFKSFVNVQLENLDDLEYLVDSEDGDRTYEPIVLMQGDSPTVINANAAKLLSHNHFYQSCKEILSSNKMPDYPKTNQPTEQKVAMIILSVLSLGLGILIGLLCAEMWSKDGFFWTIFCGLVYAGFIGLICLAVEYVPEWIDGILPSSRLIDKWHSDVYARNSAIEHAKFELNCKNNQI